MYTIEGTNFNNNNNNNNNNLIYKAPVCRETSVALKNWPIPAQSMRTVRRWTRLEIAVSYDIYSGHMTCVAVRRHAVEVRSRQVVMNARSKTDSINPLRYNWCPAEPSHLHQACTGDARTAGNCRYRNWFNYHSVRFYGGGNRMMAPTRSAMIELSTAVYAPPLTSQRARRSYVVSIIAVTSVSLVPH